MARAPTNSQLAELLALEAENATTSIRAKALRNAARAAFLWPEEAARLVRSDRALTELNQVGPFIAGLLRQWIESCERPPKNNDPLRQNFLTLTEARAILRRDPKWIGRYRGDLQMHTRWSDGSATILEMAEAAFARGYQYIGITDHAKALKIAGGINEMELARQAFEIEEINARFASEGKKFRVLKSVELNLNPHGHGDISSESLQHLDIVVGAFHSALRKTDDQTKRYLAAFENSPIHVLGHPRGRIYNYRAGLSADWRQVFDRAAELDVAVEIDSYPDRQDLDGSLLPLARAAGCRIAIDTDAHHPYQLAFVELGLAAALKAGIPASRIVNFMTVDALLKWVKRRSLRFSK